MSTKLLPMKQTIEWLRGRTYIMTSCMVCLSFKSKKANHNPPSVLLHRNTETLSQLLASSLTQLLITAKTTNSKGRRHTPIHWVIHEDDGNRRVKGIFLEGWSNDWSACVWRWWKTEGKGIRRFLRWSSHIHDNIFCRETPSVVQESTR